MEIFIAPWVLGPYITRAQYQQKCFTAPNQSVAFYPEKKLSSSLNVSVDV